MPMPYVNLAQAGCIQPGAVIKELWPEYVHNAVAVEALVVVISYLNLVVLAQA